MRFAHALEGSEVRALRHLAVHAESISSGTMGYSAPGSRSNKCVGLGIGEDIDDETLARIEAFYAGPGAPARLELTSFVPTPTRERLAVRGYGVVELGSALFFELSHPLPPPPTLTVTRVDPDDDAAVHAYVELAMSGFFPEGGIPESAMDMGMRGAKMPGADSFVASIGGVTVAAAGCGTNEGITALFGASVLATHRRKGVHHALISARMARAKELGSTLVSVVSAPGGPTERNAIRAGFQLRYVRLAWARTAS